MWELKTTSSSALLLPGTQWAWGERVGYPRGLTGDQQPLLNLSSSMSPTEQCVHRAGTLCPEKLGQHAVCFVLCHSVKV